MRSLIDVIPPFRRGEWYKVITREKNTWIARYYGKSDCGNFFHHMGKAHILKDNGSIKSFSILNDDISYPLCRFDNILRNDRVSIGYVRGLGINE